MFRKMIGIAAGILLMAALALAASELTVRKAELSTMFGSAEGYLTAVGGDVTFVNTEKPEMSVHIPGETITSSSLDRGTVTIVTSKPIHGLSTFHFKLADTGASFTLEPSGGAAPATQAATGNRAAAKESADPPRVFEVRHRHFPKGGCQGRLIVREDRLQFESLTDIGHSQLWRMSDVKTIKRRNPYKLVLKPFQGAGYEFEILRQGMSPAEFEFITRRVADSRVSD